MAMVGAQQQQQQQLRVREVYTDGSIRRAPDGPAIGPPAPAGCAWLASDNGVQWIGRCYALGYQRDSEEVELLAICFALRDAVKRAIDGHAPFDEVRIFCDCTRAMDACVQAWEEHWRQPESPVVEEIDRSIRYLHDTHGTRVAMGWVPGHAGHAVNTQVDKEAIRGAQLSGQGYARKGWWAGMGPCTESFTVEMP